MLPLTSRIPSTPPRRVSECADSEGLPPTIGISPLSLCLASSLAGLLQPDLNKYHSGTTAEALGCKQKRSKNLR